MQYCNAQMKIYLIQKNIKYMALERIEQGRMSFVILNTNKV
jgi:hypothetical protein